MDPNLDQNCTGGVVLQTGAPAICIVHQTTITIPSGLTLSVAGKDDMTGRAIAFVADGDLAVDGTLDASGHPRMNGPGGGSYASGTMSGNVQNANFDAGAGGGAGGATPGGAGGSYNSSGTGVDGGGQPGGAARANPAQLAAFMGGGASTYYDPGDGGTTLHGGGGGAVMLISCHGTVRIDGTVNAGGGGGTGGFVAIIPFAGEGGGAGGYVSVEAPKLALHGSLFANGGGGGAGSTGVTVDGQDGSLSDSTPAQGGSTSGAGSGGTGGIGSQMPGVGKHPPTTAGSAGGGGGSFGFLQVYAPANSSPDLQLTHVSPPLQPTGVAQTK